MAISDYYGSLTLLKKGSNTNTQGRSVGVWTADTSAAGTVSGVFQGVINQVTSREIDVNMKMDIDADHKLYCPVNVGITKSHRVQSGARTYRVVSDPKDTMNQGHHYKVFLKRSSDEEV